MSYDILPANKRVRERDTLVDFSSSFEVRVTNPPWFARNSATEQGLAVPLIVGMTTFMNSHLGNVLITADGDRAFVLESFIRTELFQECLSDFISLTSSLVADTGRPTGLAFVSTVFGD